MHRVVISKDFYLATTTVTQRQARMLTAGALSNIKTILMVMTPGQPSNCLLRMQMPVVHGWPIVSSVTRTCLPITEQIDTYPDCRVRRNGNMPVSTVLTISGSTTPVKVWRRWRGQAGLHMESSLVTGKAIPVTERMRWRLGKRLSWAFMICKAMCGSGAVMHGQRMRIGIGLTVSWTLCPLLAPTACSAVARGSTAPPIAALRFASGTIPFTASGTVVFVWVCFRSRASQNKLQSSGEASCCVHGRPARRDDEWASLCSQWRAS